MSDNDYVISNHAKERYAQRIMGKEDVDANRFISLNEDKIVKDINKMITFGDIIYEGKSLKTGKMERVFMKDLWIVITAPESKTVVTLFAIDLGVGDDMNYQYRDMLMERLNKAKAEYQAVADACGEDVAQYQALIKDYEEEITDHRRTIKSLEELITTYKTLIDQQRTRLKVADDKVKDVINIMTSKRIS